MSEKLVQSKNALPTTGSIWVEITFKVIEIKNKIFRSQGQSAFFYNIRKNKNKALKNAIYNAYKKVFPAETKNMYDIIILHYQFNYYLSRYQIIEKDNKYYERFREKNRTRYYVINDKHLLKPDESFSGIQWEDK
jgi:hypothetical protein